MRQASGLMRYAADGLLILVAVGVVATAAYRFFAKPKEVGTVAIKVGEWEGYHNGGQALAESNAPKVTIVEFSDFQCPYCRRMADTLAGIAGSLGSNVRIIYRHLPLPNHTHARTAAFASECAAASGKFAEYAKLLFAKQDSLGAIGWEELAMRVKISDTASFARCVRDSTYASRVRADEQAARRLGAYATPTILVNEWNVGANADLLRGQISKVVPR
jgi:protein-disulfide isomerase